MFLKLLCVVVLIKSVHLAVEQDYYWKDYKGGTISKNCLKLDRNSEVYIGQTYSRTFGLRPATIFTTSPYVESYSGNIKFFAYDNVKMLCSQFLDKFRWVNTSAPNYKSLPNLVPSGNQGDKKLFLGRVYVNEKPVLGVLGDTLLYFEGSKKRKITGPFEVLTYDKPPHSGCSIRFLP